MPYSLGNPTVNKGFLKSESHKLHQAFTVAAATTIYKAQPVKLNATGEVVPAAADEAKEVVIGFAVFGAEATEEVTVVMKSASIAYYTAADAFDPTNLITYSGFDVPTEYNQVKTALATAANSLGWALDVAAAPGDVVRVALY